MPNIHAYLPDELYTKWKLTFNELGIDPSQWVRSQFSELLNKKTDLKSLQKLIIEKKDQLEKLKVEIENLESLTHDIKLLEEKRREMQEKENQVIRELEPAWIINMTKGIMQTYGLDDEKIARKYAIEYLSLKEIKGEKITVNEFMKDKFKEISV